MADLNRVIDVQIALPGGAAFVLSITVGGTRFRNNDRLVDRLGNAIFLRDAGIEVPLPEVTPTPVGNYLRLRDLSRLVDRNSNAITYRN